MNLNDSSITHAVSNVSDPNTCDKTSEKFPPGIRTMLCFGQTRPNRSQPNDRQFNVDDRCRVHQLPISPSETEPSISPTAKSESRCDPRTRTRRHADARFRKVRCTHFSPESRRPVGQSVKKSLGKREVQPSLCQINFHGREGTGRHSQSG